jgi:RNA polymerase sigma factor (sigma-70 family)
MDLCDCDWKAAELAGAYLESRRRGLRFLGRILRDPHAAEDVLHDSWLRALERGTAGEKPPERAPEFWMQTFRIAHRARRRARREAPQTIVGIGPGRVAGMGAAEMGAAGVGPAREGAAFWVAGARWSAPELLEMLRVALESLPEVERRLLVRHYDDRQSARQLSRELGITRFALLSRLKRGRHRLRKAVEQRLRDRIRAASGESATEQSRAAAPGSPGRRASKE